MRKKLFGPFSESIKTYSLTPRYSCYSVCSLNCVCSDDKCKFSFISVNDDAILPVKVRTVTDKDSCLVQEKLLDLHLSKAHRSLLVPSGVASGFTNEIIYNIIQRLRFIDSVDYLKSNLPILGKRKIYQYSNIIQHVIIIIIIFFLYYVLAKISIIQERLEYFYVIFLILK